MARKEESDAIGPDPVRWVDRLREVNEGSAFPHEEKVLIDNALMVLTAKLVFLTETPNGDEKQAG